MDGGAHLGEFVLGAAAGIDGFVRSRHSTNWLRYGYAVSAGPDQRA